MPNCGWVKIPRSIVDWEWYGVPPVRDLYFHLIVEANHEPKKWQGITVDRGQMVTSIAELSRILGFPVKTIRGAIEKLVDTGYVAKSSTPKYTVFTVINYDEYQAEGKRRANEGQTEGKQGANEGQSKGNKQECKNDKNERMKEDIPPYPPQGDGNCDNQNQGESLMVSKTAGGNARYFTTLDDSFAKFWAAYPKKVSKPQAQKAWQKLKPDEDLLGRILQAIESQKKSDQWQRDKGQYIPYPATWLNNRRWEDDLKISTSHKGAGGNKRSNDEPSYDLSQLFPDD